MLLLRRLFDASQSRTALRRVIQMRHLVNDIKLSFGVWRHLENDIKLHHNCRLAGARDDERGIAIWPHNLYDKFCRVLCVFYSATANYLVDCFVFVSNMFISKLSYPQS